MTRLARRIPVYSLKRELQCHRIELADARIIIDRLPVTWRWQRINGVHHSGWVAKIGRRTVEIYPLRRRPVWLKAGTPGGIAERQMAAA